MSNSIKGLLFLVLLSSCSHSVKDVDCPWTDQDQLDVGDELRLDWISTFGEDPGSFREVGVSCDLPWVRCGEMRDDECIAWYYGVTTSPDTVWIRPIDHRGRPLAADQSALRHEYIHVGLHRLFGDYFGLEDEKWLHSDPRWILAQM